MKFLTRSFTRILMMILAATAPALAKFTSQGTVAIYNPQTGNLCSGVLIAKNAVLTVPYCIESKDTMVVFGSELLEALKNKENTRTITRVVSAPQYSPKRVIQDNTKNAALLAIVFLDFPAPAEIQPQALAETTTKIAGGETLAITGFKVHDDASVYRTKVKIKDDKYSLTEFSISPKSSSTTCPGEAGSPLFKGPPGNGLVVGIMAFRKQTQPCYKEAVVTKIAPYRTWIQQKLK